MTDIELRQDIEQKLAFLNEKKLQELHEHLNQLLEKEENVSKLKKKRHLVGSMPGLVTYMAEDFNEPLDDFKDYMPE